MKFRKYFVLKDFETEQRTTAQFIQNVIDPSNAHTVEATKISQMLALRYSYYAIVYYDYDYFYKEPELPEQEDEKLQEWKNKMQYIFEVTFNKYKALLDAYESTKTNLLDTIKSKQTTQFNDTPQTTNAGLDGDEYATTYTVQNGEVGFEAIERLAKINTLYKNVLLDWCLEFSGLFVSIN